MTLTFYKYQGTGNDFIMIDDRNKTFPAHNNALVAQLCDRRFGIGADGLILLQNHPTTDFYMQYYNSDGNESSMCGNGGRCIVAFANQLGVIKEKTVFTAIDGVHEATYANQRVELKMNDVTNIDCRADEVFVLNTGSPHYVQFKKEDILTTEIVPLAKSVRYNNEFTKEGINVNFANILGDTNLQMRTYERGVEDETLSCGTGVTATAIALAIKNGSSTGPQNVQVKVMGGALEVTYDFNKELPTASNVWLKGPAVFVFEGKVSV